MIGRRSVEHDPGPPRSLMTINVHKREGVNYIKLPGELTIARDFGVTLQETFDRLLDTGDRIFIFDMTDTRFVDSAGLAMIVACHKKATGRGGSIKLVIDERSSTREVLAVTHLDRVLDISLDKNDGLAGFRP
jgi:anti-anti-sigma factor